MITKGRKTKSRIPEFASIEEEAEFWDTHDTTDYEDEFKPVQVRFADKLSDSVSVPVDPEMMVLLQEQARKEGTVPAILIRKWIVERLQDQRQHSTSA
jgi:CopG antitoxin of type II toxin-antitoxin system